MPKYKVRNGFSCPVLIGKEVRNYLGGEEIELTPEQYEKVKHMLEEVELKSSK